jgi:hypothetical protein
MKVTLFLFVAVSCTVLAQDGPRSIESLESFSPSPSQVFYLDLDTAAGASSEWRHDVIGTLSALQATVRVQGVRPDPKWSPTFALWLEKSDAGQKHNRVTVQIFPPPDQKSQLAIRILRVDDGKLALSEGSDTTVSLNESVNLKMVWTTSSMLIKIGGSEVHKVPIPWLIDSVGVSASTGEMEVDRLVLGSVVR